MLLLIHYFSNLFFMHWFIDPIKNHYADFKGRATRQQFWMFVLWYMILGFAVMATIGILQIILIAVLFDGNSIAPVILSAVLGLFFLCVVLYILIPQIALQVRRLHDVNMSGWWCLLGLIPYIGSLILIILCCLPSKPGNNKWGPNPYGIEVENQVGIMPVTTTVTTTTVSTITTSPATQSDSLVPDVDTNKGQ
jgi:uncharacterized membrane protein YhaH (DUF805 family)